ncbi:MAG: hypothetical protein DYH15_11715 [Nitrosomonas sp. PRO4]|nr:hypothetical protein [Nitrosomonas sp. PRO4]
MAIQYEGYTILVSGELDNVSGDWNGRYRIVDREGIVVYESFSDAAGSEEEALADAEAAAYNWIDSQ